MRRALVAAVGWLAPLGALAASVVAPLSLARFQAIFALASWLMAGYLALTVGWLARDARTLVAGRELRLLVAPVMVLGLAVVPATVAFVDLLRVPGVDAYNLGHAFWLGFDAAALALLGAVLLRPQVPARPMRTAALVAAGVTAGAWFLAPVLPPFVGPDGATPLYDASLGTLAAAALALSLAFWLAWLRDGEWRAALWGQALTLLGLGFVGFLFQRSAVEVPAAWFGRVTHLAAMACFLAVVLRLPEDAAQALPPTRGAAAPPAG